MSQEPRIPDVYGPGTYTDREFVPVPKDAERIFRLLASQTPGFTRDEALLSKVRFTGEEYPVIPGPVKAVPVAAALHAMAGVLADEILAIRGEENKDREITVNTTHVSLWLSAIAPSLLDGEHVIPSVLSGKLGKDVVPDWEQGWTDTPLKYRATALYPTSDPETWYCLHGSMKPEPVLRSIGIDPSSPEVKDQSKTPADAAALIAKHMRRFSPEKLEMTNILNGFCGSICFTPKQWNESEMGKSLARHPVVNVRPQPQAVPTPPIAFPARRAGDRRPLAGVRIVELTRVIAGPQIGAVLASFGADIIRVNAPHLPDINLMQVALNAGKRTIACDLRRPEDAALLRGLVEQADVFIQGFRLGKMARHGLGLDDLLRAAGARGRGLVYVSENCYGPDGCYAERPGWQQIADTCAGTSHVMGRSLDLPGGECVLPSLPISDMTTGAIGAVGAMLALRDRAARGGSYYVHAALAAVNAYALTPEVGLYPRRVVDECKERFRWAEMRGQHHVLDLMITVWDGWRRALGDAYLAEDGGWYQTFEGPSAFGGKRLSILRPIVQLSDRECTPEWRSPSVPYAYHKAEETHFL